MSKYTISCPGMNERDVALIKSLLSIVGKVADAEWEFSESDSSDIVVVDTESRGHLTELTGRKPKAVIAYASPDNTLIPNTFTLSKPARARDLIQVLEAIHTKLN